MAVRFILGMAEGGISPAYVLITGTWYKKDEIPLRITLWYCGNGLAIILQSFIAYGVGHIDTGIAVWRWFFIIFGILGLFWAVVLYIFMPDSALTAKFLSENEKAIAVERLRENRTGIINKEFKKSQAIEALLDVKVWYGFFYAICCVVPSTAVASVCITPDTQTTALANITSSLARSSSKASDITPSSLRCSTAPWASPRSWAFSRPVT